MPALASRIQRLRPSLVREILSAAQARDVISLAGGLPAPEAMPEAALPPPGWEQYGTTEGEPALREEIARLCALRGLDCPAERILLTHGSQQGIDLAAKLLVEEGTTIACESPTYLSALQVLDLFGAEIRSVRTGATGPDPAAIEQLFAGSRPAVFYAAPLFSNPTGAVWGPAARAALATACDAAGTVLIEDDPYRETAIDPAGGATCPRPLCAELRRASWIYLGSFSKSLLPGLRLGFLAASADLFPFLVRLKQAADLHTSRLSQAIALADLRAPGRQDRLARLQQVYRLRRDAFAESLARRLPEASWNLPGGGLFFWARWPHPVGMRQVLDRALARGVAFLPGEACFPEAAREEGWMRLNFSHAAPEMADEGLRRLGECLRLDGRTRAPFNS